jgi:hypothetical protein
MQHKVVCKLLLKVVCGSSFLFFGLFQVSQSVRLTSALANHSFEESSIFCTALDSFVHIICSRHTRSGLCAAGEIVFRPPRLTDDENRNKS